MTVTEGSVPLSNLVNRCERSFASSQISLASDAVVEGSTI
jgi:hypothetical protein